MNKRSVRRIIGACLLILSLIIVMIPAEESAAETSKTSDFQLNGDILIKYTGTADTVSVPNGVKKIGEEAFADNSYIKTLKLSSSVEEIAYGAFANCNNLTKVEIPDNVETIGSAAFSNCTALNTVSIGAGVKSMGTGVFVGDKALTTFSISDKNTKFIYKDGVIYDNKSETIIFVLPARKGDSYTMPNSVKEIYPYAFYGSSNIKDITVSNTIYEIPAYAFSYCNGLKAVNLPYSVNIIDVKAFENCVNLQDVTIPESVNFIHPTAFDGCPKLNIIAKEGTYAYNWFKNFDKSNVAIIDNEDNDSSGNKNNGSEEEPEEDNYYNSHKIIYNPDDYMAETIVAGRHAVFFIDNTRPTVLEGELGTNMPAVSEGLDELLNNENRGKGVSLPKFTIIDGSVAGKAFYGDTDLYSYEFPEGIKSIGDFSFARSALKQITIPDGVTHIGYGAFYHCDDLVKIVVPKTVTEIEPYAFDNTRMLENFMLYGDESFMILGDGILTAYRGTGSSVTIPDTVKKIGPDVFSNHTEITSVNIPDSVTEVGEGAFAGCSSLANVNGGMNIEKISDRAFAGCPLDNIRMMDTVKEVGLKAFDYTSAGLPDERKLVYFHGNGLPSLGISKTTTRLSNDSFRKDAFEGVKVAVIQSEDIIRNGTCLDRNLSGFSGLICVVDDPNTDYENGTLKIIDCTLSSEEASIFTVPDTMYIYGKAYRFKDTELENVLNMAKDGAYAGEAVAGNPVTFAGSDDKYYLRISDDNTEYVKEAYKRIFGETAPGNFYGFKIELKDGKTGTEITKFGKQKLNVTVLIPENMPAKNIHVICTDENLQLEDLSYEKTEVDNKLAVSFDITHTGHYGLYSYSSGASSDGELDDSPDTGDPIHPKYFLALGVFAIAMALLLYRSKKDMAI
jgi:hypothetical protein